MGAGPSQPQPPGLDAPRWAVALQPVAALIHTAGPLLLRSWFTPCPNPLGGHGGHLGGAVAFVALVAPLGYITWCGWKHGRLSYLLPAGAVAGFLYYYETYVSPGISMAQNAGAATRRIHQRRRDTIEDAAFAVVTVGGLAIPHLLTCCHGCRATKNVPASWRHDDEIPSWVSRPSISTRIAPWSQGRWATGALLRYASLRVRRH